jgi:hypothetical protein
MREYEQRQGIVDAYINCAMIAFNVPPKVMLSRKRCAVQARCAVMYLLSERFHDMSAKDGFGLMHLGKMTGKSIGRHRGYDHATVLHAIRSAQTYLKSPDRISRYFRQNYETLLKLIQKNMPYNSTAAQPYRENRKLHNAIRNKAIWNANRYVTI